MVLANKLQSNMKNYDCEIKEFNPKFINSGNNFTKLQNNLVSTIFIPYPYIHGRFIMIKIQYLPKKCTKVKI